MINEGGAWKLVGAIRYSDGLDRVMAIIMILCSFKQIIF